MDHNQLIASSQKFNITGLGIQASSTGDATQKFEKYLSQIVGVLTIIAVLFFVAQIIFAGYAFISSQGDEKVMEASRKRLTEAVLGLTIVVIAVGLGSLIAWLLGVGGMLDINAMFKSMGL